MIKIKRIIHSRYQLIEHLYDDFIYSVWKGYDKQEEKSVIINQFHKTSSLYNKEDLIKFKSEIALLIRYPHHGIMKILAIGEEEGTLFIISEYFKGIRLSEYLKKHNTGDLFQGTAIIKKIARALDFLHSKGIIHGSLNPEHIWYDYKETGEIKIAGYNHFPFLNINLTDQNEKLINFFYYISPEAGGMIKSKLNKSSDLYSLGIIFYHLCTGALPFHGNNIEDILHKHVAEPIASPILKNNLISKDLEDILLKLLNKNQKDRFLYISNFMKTLKPFKNKLEDIHLSMAESGFVGREKELAFLKLKVDNAGEAAGETVLISGESGVGKTRLVKEIKKYVREKEGIFISGKCVPGDTKIPYKVIHDAFFEYTTKVKELPPEVKDSLIKQIKKAVGQLGDILIKINPILREIIGPTTPLVKLDPEKENSRFLNVNSNFISSMGMKKLPVVLFLDDLQWIDAGSFNILSDLVSRIKKMPVLVIGTYRIEEVDKDHMIYGLIHDKQNPITPLALESFSSHWLKIFVANVFDVTPGKVSHALETYLMEKSKGNLFFTIQILKHLLDENIITRDQFGLYPDEEALKHISISSIIDVLVKRIKLLKPDEKKVIGYGAFIGAVFSKKLLSDISRLSQEEIEKILNKAFQLHFLEPEGLYNIKFVHDRIQEAFYNEIDPKDRRNIHLIIAEHIENKQFKDDNIIFYLANHYIHSQKTAKILEYSIPAGKMSKTKYANVASIRYFKLAAKLLEEIGRTGDALWLEVCENLSEVYLTTGDSQKVIHLTRKMLPYVKNKLSKAALFRKITEAYFRKGDFHKCEYYGRKGLRLLGEKLPDKKPAIVIGILKELIIHIIHSFFSFFYIKEKKIKNKEKYELICFFYLTLNWAYILADQLKFGRSIFRLLNLSESKLGKSIELGRSIGAYASLCMSVALFKRSILYHNKALQLKRELKDQYGIAQSLQFIGFFYEWSGDYVKAEKFLIEAGESFKQIGDTKDYNVCLLGLVEVYILTSQYQKAREKAERYLSIAKKSADSYAIGNGYNNLFKVYMEQGDYRKARKYLIKGYKISKKDVTNVVFCLSHMDLGRYFLEQKNYSRASKHLERAKNLNTRYPNMPYYVANLSTYYAEAKLKEYSAALEAGTQNSGLKIPVKKACKDALKQTAPWASHHGGALRLYGMFMAIMEKEIPARRYFQKSIVHCEKHNRPFETGLGYFEMGKYLNRQANKEDARKYLEKAYIIFREINASAYLNKTRKLLEIRNEESAFLEKFKDKRKLSSIIKISQKISSILDIQKLLETVVKEAISLTGASYGAIYIHNQTVKKLELKAFHYLNAEETTPFIKNAREDIVRLVFDRNKPIINYDYGKKLSSASSQEIANETFKSLLCVPINLRDEQMGVFYLENRLSSLVFNKNDVELLNVFLSQVSISLENASLYRNLENKVEERTFQLKDTLRELEFSNKELEHFAYVVSHDLKEPLRMVSGFLKLLKKKYHNQIDKNADEYIFFAVDGAERMAKMIDGLLDYSRVGKKEKEKVTVDCEQVLKEVLINLSFVIDETDAEISHTKLPIVKGHHLLLIQLFQNLVSNAIKFSDESKRLVTVNVREEKNVWLFTVKDNGIGIAEADQQKIFQIFGRARTPRSYPGSGIGLAVCKKIVDFHGGRMWVESAIGKGASFYFSIPKENPC